MTRDQIKKVSKQGAEKAAKSGKPVSVKHVQRLAELKAKRATTVVEYEQRKRA